MNLTNCLRRVVRFYVDGFRQMTWGRTLWVLILAKLFVLFVLLRLFFFQPVLAGLSEEEKPDAVADGLLETGPAETPAVTVSNN